ncbi:hypothetical protein EJB05_30460, partial [Eragrostis curvula]
MGPDYYHCSTPQRKEARKKMESRCHEIKIRASDKYGGSKQRQTATHVEGQLYHLTMGYTVDSLAKLKDDSRVAEL